MGSSFPAIFKIPSKTKARSFWLLLGLSACCKNGAKCPELFYAYIGHSQLIHPAESNLWAYHQLFKLAQEAKDTASLCPRRSFVLKRCVNLCSQEHSG